MFFFKSVCFLSKVCVFCQKCLGLRHAQVQRAQQSVRCHVVVELELCVHASLHGSSSVARHVSVGISTLALRAFSSLFCRRWSARWTSSQLVVCYAIDSACYRRLLYSVVAVAEACYVYRGQVQLHGNNARLPAADSASLQEVLLGARLYDRLGPGVRLSCYQSPQRFLPIVFSRCHAVLVRNEPGPRFFPSVVRLRGARIARSFRCTTVRCRGFGIMITCCATDHHESGSCFAALAFNLTSVSSSICTAPALSAPSCLLCLSSRFYDVYGCASSLFLLCGFAARFMREIQSGQELTRTP